MLSQSLTYTDRYNNILFLYDMVRTPGDESWNMYNRRDMGVAYEALFGKQCVGSASFLMFSHSLVPTISRMYRKKLMMSK